MGDRERKRAERRKRKERGIHRQRELEERRARMAARTETKNRAAREALEPLGAGERPRVVTVGAVISTIVSAIFLGSAAIAVLTDIEVDGSEPSLFYLLAFAGVTGTMAWGMWRVRYWAVLGFQTLLVLIIVTGALGLVVAGTAPQAIGTTLLVGGAGTLFYFMVKAMARIQMPERRPRD